MSHVGGYEETFVEFVPRDLECPVCFLVIRKPLLTPCGHLICTTCADQLTNDDELKCPMENNTFPRREAVPDRFHERKILALFVKCPHEKDGCGWTGKLRLLENHLAQSGDCKFADFKCTFSFAGCTDLLHRSNLQAHDKDHMGDHLALVKAAYDDMEAKNGHLNEQVTRLESEVIKLQTEISQLKSVARTPAAFAVEWTIENWTATVQTARSLQDYSIFSRPYYVSHPGYKVCLQAYPNGRQAADAAHLSLYLKIMRGRYDNELAWPYPHMYTVTVLDQQPGGKKVSRSEDPPIASPGAANSFRKPISDGNSGWGWCQFISHNDLRTRMYTKDDCVRVRLEVFLS